MVNNGSVAQESDPVQNAHDLYGANLAFHEARAKHGTLSPQADDALQVLESVEALQGIRHTRTADDYHRDLVYQGYIVYLTYFERAKEPYRVTLYKLVDTYPNGVVRDHVASELVLVAFGTSKLEALKNACKEALS